MMEITIRGKLSDKVSHAGLIPPAAQLGDGGAASALTTR
jgi:hypothetical protein